MNLGQHITLQGLKSSLVIFIMMTIMLIWKVYSHKDSTDPDAPGVYTTLISELTQQINFIVILAVMSFPEGLPLVIGISLAFSVMKMYNDKLLVRNLDAPEKMGQIQEVCIGKTGTLTTGDMHVSKFYIEERIIKNSRKGTVVNCDFSEETSKRIVESILYNCTAQIEMN